jgi:hypothetical protein
MIRSGNVPKPHQKGRNVEDHQRDSPIFTPILPWGRCGERISTGFVESTINQLIAKRFVKKQQMRWTPRGAHLLLQVRV